MQGKTAARLAFACSQHHLTCMLQEPKKQEREAKPPTAPTNRVDVLITARMPEFLQFKDGDDIYDVSLEDQRTRKVRPLLEYRFARQSKLEGESKDEVFGQVSLEQTADSSDKGMPMWRLMPASVEAIEAILRKEWPRWFRSCYMPVFCATPDNQLPNDVALRILDTFESE